MVVSEETLTHNFWDHIKLDSPFALKFLVGMLLTWKPGNRRHPQYYTPTKAYLINQVGEMV